MDLLRNPVYNRSIIGDGRKFYGRTDRVLVCDAAVKRTYGFYINPPLAARRRLPHRSCLKRKNKWSTENVERLYIFYNAATMMNIEG